MSQHPIAKLQHDLLQRLHATFRDDISAKESSFALLFALGEYAGALIASHATDVDARKYFVDSLLKAAHAGMDGYDQSLTLVNEFETAQKEGKIN